MTVQTPENVGTVVPPATLEDSINSSKIARALVTPRETQFSFRKFKEDIKGADGKPVLDTAGKAVQKEVKRPSFKLLLPIPTADALLAALQDPKQQLFLIDLVSDAVKGAAKEQVDDESKPVNSQKELDVSKLTIEYLASQPASERRGSGIAEEVWKAWSADYCAVMPEIAGRPAENIAKGAAILVKKFAPIKTNKPVLQRMMEYLSMYMDKAPNASEYMEVLEYLLTKGENLINAEEQDLLETL